MYAPGRFFVNGAELFQRNERGQFQPVFRLEDSEWAAGLGVPLCYIAATMTVGAAFVPVLF